jgi:membrane-associated phospholipid phosphatase
MDVPSAIYSLYAPMRPFLIEASAAFDNPVFAVAFSAAFVFAVLCFFKEQKKLPYLVIAVLVALALGSCLKLLISEGRPCADKPGKIPCPPDFSRPSLHALLAFTVVIACVGSRSFPVFLLFALFMAFSRVYLGVHTITQVASGLALAFLACVAAEIIWKGMKWEMPQEIKLRHGAGRIH